MRIFVLCLLFANTCFCQVLNGSFEAIYTNTSTSKVFFTSWSGDGFGADTTSASRSGNYAALLWTWYSYSPGTMYYGGANNPGTLMNGGLPISTTPSLLCGYYKFDTSNVLTPDSAFVFLALKKFNAATGKRDTLAFCSKKLPPVNVYTPFTMPITYKMPGIQPDSIVIIFATDNHYLFQTDEVKNRCKNTHNNCAYFYIDDLSLSTPQGIRYLYSNQSPTTAYPNPATSEIRLRFNRCLSASDDPALVVYDVAGQKVLDEKDLTGTEALLDLSGFCNGIYFYTVQLKSGETLYGKFSVDLK